MKANGMDMVFPGFADTGLWKLVVSVRDNGISAFAVNTLDPEVKPFFLFDKDWQEDEGALLENIETAIYENPRILDDFATHIVVETSRVLWIPAALTDDEEFNASYYTDVFPCREEDIRADFGGEEVAVYSLAAGLNGFLQRTLPGCRVSCSASILKNHFQSGLRDTDSPAVSVYMPGGSRMLNRRFHRADLFAFGPRGQFLSGSAQPWREIPDLAYRILLLCQSYGLDREDTAVNIYADPSTGNKLRELLISNFNTVNLMPLPALSSSTGLPMAAALLAE